jgi:hypothetical protein
MSLVVIPQTEVVKVVIAGQASTLVREVAQVVQVLEPDVGPQGASGESGESIRRRMTQERVNSASVTISPSDAYNQLISVNALGRVFTVSGEHEIKNTGEDFDFSVTDGTITKVVAAGRLCKIYSVSGSLRIEVI